MRKFGNSMGPFPSDFTTDFQSDYKSLYKNWGTGKQKYPSEWVSEFGGGPFAPNFPVCTWEGGKTVCPSEYVKEFSGIGDMVAGKGICIAVSLAIGAVVGYYLRHSEIIVLG